MAGSQIVRYGNILQGYVPADPNSFPDNLSTPDPRKDEIVPVRLYDGYNFLPTAYGCKSYFGLTKKLAGPNLTAKVDYILLYQSQTLKNFLIALCDTGIWIKYGGDSSAWEQIHTLPGIEDTDGLYYPWSYAILENKLYMYRQGEPSYQLFSSKATAPGYELTSVTPTFINMAAQMGLFRAGDRLGFWDSANATAWSSLDDFGDFEPSIETGAGIVTFGQIIGKITTILGHGDGFVLYCTRSVLYIQRKPDSLYLWEPTRLLQDTGVAYRKQAVAAIPDTSHFAYTTTGIYLIQEGKPELIAPDAFDYFKLISSPKYLSYLEGRYLFINVLDEDLIVGKAQYSDAPVDQVIVDLPTTDFEDLLEGMDDGTYPDVSICDLLGAIEQGLFIPGNTAYNPLHPEDYGPPPSGKWKVEASGINITGYPYIIMYADEPGGAELASVSAAPVEGAFSYSVEATHAGAIYIEWHVASDNPATLTVTFRGNIVAIIPAEAYSYGYGTYTV